MRKTVLSIQFVLATLALVACGAKNANTDNSSSQTDSLSTKNETIMETKTATIDDISQFVSWEMGAMSVSNEGENFILQDTKGPLTLVLEPTTNGVYQEISEDHDMIGQGARFVAEKIGDVTTLTAYNDKMVLFTLLSCDDLKEYRNKAYRRLLTRRFEPTEDGLITITDEVMKGPILPESPDLTYFFIEDDEGDLTDKIRLSPGRYHLAFSPADKGVNLHFCAINPETGDLDVLYERENSIILRYAKDPEWPWLSTDVLDAGFLIYNFDKPYWKVMLDKLKAIKQPNEVEQWNRRLIENLIEYNEPFTGLGSTDY